MNRTLSSFTVLQAVLAMSIALVPTAAADDRAADRPFPLPAQTILRLARSHDGLSFTDTGEILTIGGGSPDLTLLPNGDLIAIFDAAIEPGRGYQSVPVVVRSKDDGRNWSAARRIRIRGGDDLRAHHLDLVVRPGGPFQLFFAAESTTPGRYARPEQIRMAVTRDGINYRTQDDSRLLLPRGHHLYPVAGWVGTRLNVMVDTFGALRRPGVQRIVSHDAHRFAKGKTFTMKDVRFCGSMIPTERGVRAYVSSPSSMKVFDSDDGRVWKPRPGAHLPQGWDAGVVQLGPHSFLMAYCAARTQESPPSSTLVSVDHIVGPEASDDSWDDSASPGEPETQKPAAETVALMDDFGTDGGNLDGYDAESAGGFAPRPGFDHKVSYIEWYKEYALGHPADNAADFYAALMPQLEDQPGDKPEWPKFHDMFHDTEYDGPPAPWNPKDHPEWEATSQAAADLFEKYKEASQHKGYAIPYRAPNDPDMDAAERDLLMGILLPDLSSHRTLAKAILADAWRSPDGQVSPQRMEEAIDATLRAANHMRQGSTIIEDLVGIAISAHTNKNARWALKRGVFSPEEMKSVLDTLQQRDVDDRDPQKTLRGEHAFAMDFTQHLFTPPTANGAPHFNRRRATRAMSWWNDEKRTADLVDRTSKMTPDDVRKTLDAMDDFYHELGDMMRIGYPQVRAADVAALEQRKVNTSPLTESIMPSLSRYYLLQTRGRADRRATQLAFAVEVFKTQNGYYPESLDAIPPGRNAGMTTDPFTGRPFGYQLTEDGPRIYSLSEDGIDNGGSHSPQWSDHGGNEQGSDDYVFWPPQR